jgi:hypothetical protein
LAGSREFIEDEVSTDKTVDKYCNHRKISFYPNGVDLGRFGISGIGRIMYFWTEGSSYWPASSWSFSSTPKNFLDSENVIVDPPSVDKALLRRQAVQAMTPKFPAPEISMINFLWELKDLKELAVKAKNIETALRALSVRDHGWVLNSAWRDVPPCDYINLLREEIRNGMLKHVWRDFVRFVKQHKSLLAGPPSKPPKYGDTVGALQQTANWHLAIQFGLRPLLSDLHTLFDFANTINQKVEHLQAHSGLIGKMHYKKKVLSSEKGGDFEFSEVGALKHQRIINYRMVYHLSCKASYDMPDLTTSSGALAATLDSMGFVLGPSVVWNAIPYSFVVDWFSNVGDILSTYDFRFSDWNFKIHSACESLTYKHKEKGYILPRYPMGLNPKMFAKSYDLKKQSYVRTPNVYIPEVAELDFIFPTFSNAGIDQYFLGYCLGISRIHN